MEELLLGQVRGILILANGHKASGNTATYFRYLKRAQNLLAYVEEMRSHQQKLAA